MLIKKWKKDSTHYWMKVNFKNKTAYTDIIQITLENPWLLPKYEDDFAGIKGLRLYGWLFFYFGRYYAGFIYPATRMDKITTPIVGPDGNRWFVITKDKIENFNSSLALIKKYSRVGFDVVYSRHYIDEKKYNIIATIKKRA